MAKGAVEAIYEASDQETRDILWFLLGQSDVSGAQIALALRADGHQINRHQVEHFRRKIQSGNYGMDGIAKPNQPR